ncbi:hypothetical protein LJR015_002945 [Peribacillus frigoritolerans]|nr:hypothetical protein [Peribacillus simplex]
MRSPVLPAVPGSDIGRGLNANGTIGRSIAVDLQKMSLNCLTSYPTYD